MKSRSKECNSHISERNHKNKKAMSFKKIRSITRVRRLERCFKLKLKLGKKEFLALEDLITKKLLPLEWLLSRGKVKW